MNEEYWIFTFGYGQKHQGYYVKIFGGFFEARAKMYDKYGEEWSMQYSAKHWDDVKNNPDRFWPMEKELEVIK